MVSNGIRCIAIALTLVSAALGQTATYHLHQEASVTNGLMRLQTSNPDTSSAAQK